MTTLPTTCPIHGNTIDESWCCWKCEEGETVHNFCENQPFAGPIEAAIGYADGYAARSRRQRWEHNQSYVTGFLQGIEDRQSDDAWVALQTRGNQS